MDCVVDCKGSSKCIRLRMLLKRKTLNYDSTRTIQITSFILSLPCILYAHKFTFNFLWRAVLGMARSSKMWLGCKRVRAPKQEKRTHTKELQFVCRHNYSRFYNIYKLPIHHAGVYKYVKHEDQSCVV
jgi:hypothetical protein